MGDCADTSFRLADSADEGDALHGLRIGEGIFGGKPTVMEYRIGKSAGGEMHLSAACLCTECNMLVEIGTDDCPHSAAMGKPLPPTAEQTSIARFNALADQIRDYRSEILSRIAALDSRVDVHTEHLATIERMIQSYAAGTNQHVTNMEMDIARHVSLKVDEAFASIRLNVAVAKNKAAPLVGKRAQGGRDETANNEVQSDDATAVVRGHALYRKARH